MPMFEADRWARLLNEDADIDRNDIVHLVKLIAIARGKTRESFSHALHDPARLARLSFHWLRGAALAYGFRSLAAHIALMMLGCAIVGLEFGKPCELCFRRCIPWQRRCPEHSRHRRYFDQSARIRANVRRARRHTQPRLQSAYASAYDRCTRVLAFSLWTPSEASHEPLRRAIAAAALESPRVRAALPDAFDRLSAKQMHAALRTSLDGLEPDFAAWPQKITDAQVWLERDRPTRKNSRARTNVNVALAARLHNEGYTVAQIAQRLGMKRDTLKRALARARRDTSG
jgi:hypothetical protein